MTTDRIFSAIKTMILSECPQLVFAATWEYSIASVNDDGSVNGIPTGPYNLPSLNNIPFASLAAGGVSTPTIGSLFLVDFVNHNGAKYAVFSVDPTVRVARLDAATSVAIGPSAANPVELGPSPSIAVSRVGDSLQTFFPVGLLNGTHSEDGPVTNLPCYILTPVPGIVTSGNEKVLT